MTRRPLAYAVLMSLALLPTACSSGTGPGGPNVKGAWAGTVFRNSVNLSIGTESGGTVSGTIKISGLIAAAGEAFSGQVDATTRQLTWTMNDGCEAWSGTLTVSSNGSQMSGPVNVDQSTCNPPVGASQSTMTLTHQ